MLISRDRWQAKCLGCDWLIHSRSSVMLIGDEVVFIREHMTNRYNYFGIFVLYALDSEWVESVKCFLKGNLSQFVNVMIIN